MKTKLKSLSILATAALLVTHAAYAVPPHKPDLVSDGNRWLITFYNDSATGHDQWATQGLCFFRVANVGTHTRYVWYSDTFPDWNGWATQEGDQIFMHGDYARDVGHDGMEWEIVTNSPKNEGAGHWKEWRENGAFGRTIGFGNAKYSRVGKCRFNRIDDFTANIPEAEILKEVDQYRLQYVDINYPTSVEGRQIVLPSGDGLTNDVKSVLEAR